MADKERVVDGIPVLLVEPHGAASQDVPDEDGPLVLWMSHLGGSAEQTLPMLERFAAAGHPAISFDTVMHGGRGSGDPWEFAASVLASFRRRMWPILGQTTLEAMRVITWAQEQTGRRGGVLVGGVSMGGDVAVALAGVDDRVDRVAAVGSTPDWSRPDMRALGDADIIVDQGEADRYAQWFADQLDPMRHLGRYDRRVAITFEQGADDHHVPAENARTFMRALDKADRTDQHAGAEVRVQLYPGLDHLGVTAGEAPLAAAAIDWLLRSTPTS